MADPFTVGLIIAAAASVVTAGTSIASADAQREAAFDEGRANEARQRLQEIRTQRERASVIQQQRIQTAQAQATEAATGSTSSSTQGVVSSIGSQTANQLSFLDSSQTIQGNIFNRMQSAADARTKANIFAAAGTATNQIFGQTR